MDGAEDIAEDMPGDDEADDSVSGCGHYGIIPFCGFALEQAQKDTAAVKGGQGDEIEDHQDKVEREEDADDDGHGVCEAAGGGRGDCGKADCVRGVEETEEHPGSDDEGGDSHKREVGGRTGQCH